MLVFTKYFDYKFNLYKCNVIRIKNVLKMKQFFILNKFSSYNQRFFRCLGRLNSVYIINRRKVKRKLRTAIRVSRRFDETKNIYGRIMFISRTFRQVKTRHNIIQFTRLSYVLCYQIDRHDVNKTILII